MATSQVPASGNSTARKHPWAVSIFTGRPFSQAFQPTFGASASTRTQGLLFVARIFTSFGPKTRMLALPVAGSGAWRTASGGDITATSGATNRALGRALMSSHKIMPDSSRSNGRNPGKGARLVT